VEAPTWPSSRAQIGVELCSPAPSIIQQSLPRGRGCARRTRRQRRVRITQEINWACRSRAARSRLPITAGVTFSFGGVQVDAQARVINTCNEPIAGLYASGDVIGLFFHNYPSCTGQTRNAVFSHLAGRNAAALLRTN
jgi:predicted oxidoreductase